MPPLHEDVPGVVGDSSERVEIARVGQLVEIDDRRAFLGDPLPDELTADGAGAAGDEKWSHQTGFRGSVEHLQELPAALQQLPELRAGDRLRAGGICPCDRRRATATPRSEESL